MDGLVSDIPAFIIELPNAYLRFHPFLRRQAVKMGRLAVTDP